jgi:hypothetical protein
MFSLHSQALSMVFSDRIEPAEVGNPIIAFVPLPQKT